MRDVLGLRARAVLQAAGDGDVELARQVGEGLVAQEDPLEGGGDGRRSPPARAASGPWPGSPRCRGCCPCPSAELDSPAASRRSMMAGTFSMVTQRSCTCWRVVTSAMSRPGLPRDVREQPGLGRRQDAVGHADAHHEVARRGAAMEDAHPLQPLLVVVGDGLPALAREADEILGDVEAVARGLQGFDLVHRGISARRRSRTAHAFSSGCWERGSRALRVRLLALL